MNNNLKYKLPEDSQGVISVLSGGLDSGICTKILVNHYGVDRVKAISFDYGQKQKKELHKAAEICSVLGIEHRIFDLSVLNGISQGFSANVDTEMAMPTIKEVLGSPRPKTYIPNRNMILMSIAAAFAETVGFNYVNLGLQIHDAYGYHDTTQQFVDAVNSCLSQNRIIKIKVIAPFAALSKTDELKILQEVDNSSVEFTKHTLTCYNPNVRGESCGRCPSCSERIKAFMDIGVIDPIPYSVRIPWRKP